eukprot:TRINITY_DN15864_c0_g1_i2.p1 TRINITY_DN15864_c0_g1~~TRINITY_DN15864_c0_g1_i2.p1  ORF type:complete len:225 (+),score=34.96 TRINITY_DN15864_c0_g1_i2:865-1539(+)
MDKKKLLLLPWFPGQNECSWPAVAPVWIRLKGIPYHCWSSDILLSIPSSIGKPLRLDETTASQRILSYARVLVNLDVAKPSPNSISVHLEGEGVAVVEVDVQYENIPCSECLFAGHLTAGCPYAVKPGLLKLPAKVIQTENPPPSTTAESAKDASIEDTQIPVPTSEISGDIDSVLDASVLVSKIVAASQVNSLPQPRPPPIGPKVSVIAPTKAVQPECPHYVP